MIYIFSLLLSCVFQISDYESYVNLSKFVGRKSGNVEHYYRLVVSNHALRNKIGTEQAIKKFEDYFQCPPRMYTIVYLIKNDIKDWEEEDLLSISLRMKSVGRRLNLGRGGKQTQIQQKEIVDLLDKKIKKMENDIENAKKAESESKPDSLPPKPADQDIIRPTENGPGKVDEKKIKELAENWGKLPEKERAKAMLDLIQNMPIKYREVIENYIRNLAKSK